MFSRYAHAVLVLLLLSPIGPSRAASTNDELLVDTAFVDGHKHDPDWRIVDVRSAAAYAEGHIENAVNVPIDAFFDAPPRNDLIANIDAMQRLLSASGIDNNTWVIFYDEDEFHDAARAFWVLEVYGHDKVRIMDGGFRAWRAADRPKSLDTPKIAARTFIPSVEPSRLATKMSTRLGIDNPNIVLVDARTAPEYEGRVSHGARYGHIPKAVSYPSDDVFTTIDGVRFLKQKVALAEQFGGLPHDKKIITYCNIGKKSALVYFNLRRLGYDTANYDGSWHEWSQDGSLPIEPAAQPGL